MTGSESSNTDMQDMLLNCINDDAFESIQSSSSMQESNQDLWISILDIRCDSSGELIDKRCLYRQKPRDHTHDDEDIQPQFVGRPVTTKVYRRRDKNHKKKVTWAKNRTIS